MIRPSVLLPFIAPILAQLPTDHLRAESQEVGAQLLQSRRRYATPEAWEQRRVELRREFLKGAKLWPLPVRPPVGAILHSRRTYDGYSVENVALETLPGFYCTGNLYRPLGRKDLSPVILCPHGHFQPLGRFRDNHQIRCAHLARMGATVFSYSMVGWQDSQQTRHDDPLVLALQTWNSLRAVDFVTALPRVDPTRVGVTGASGGGTQSLFLTLIDERVKVSAPLVIVYPWAAPDGCLCEGGMPVMQVAGTNSIELAAAAAPRPQLLISVGNDPTQNFPNVGFPFIRDMYSVAGADDAVRNLHLANEGHDFGLTKREEVYEFFAEHLRMHRNAFNPFGDKNPQALDILPEDLDKIVIETPVQMRVFDDKHPLPPHAIQGHKQIATAFTQRLLELRKVPAKLLPTQGLQNSPRVEYEFKKAGREDERLIFTPAGFEDVGLPKVARGTDVGTLQLTVRDNRSGQPTYCRVNIVGPDGDYYEPAANSLKRHSLTGVWPESGWGNRQTKAPIRYLGRYFYCDGNASVQVPAGAVRVEVWKGFEYKPATVTTHVRPGKKTVVAVALSNEVSMPERNYWSGDPHIHIQRFDDADNRLILDLLEAEDIHFGTLLAYNNPAGPYAGFMKRMEAPQLCGLGKRSLQSRGDYSILSGEEYRTTTYGHLNLFLLDHLVMPDTSYNADEWPPYGQIGEKTRAAGGISFYAHGGYAQEIYADVVQGNIDGVELLQFGVYRGIGLIDWYHMLNAGFRVPANGASDYPACRKLGDCKTYVYSAPPSNLQAGTDNPPASNQRQNRKSRPHKPSMEDWLRGMGEGRSFFTSGPLILLEVDGQPPGSRIDHDRDTKNSVPGQTQGTHQVVARVRVRSEVAPVTNIQLIANGRLVHELTVPPSTGRHSWIEFEQEIELDKSAWIAARAFSLSRLGTPDSEAHTNPVYVYLDGQAPFDRVSLDALVTAIDGQIDIHEKRDFKEQARVIAYFERSRDILMKIRAAGGAPSHGHPSELDGAGSLTINPGDRAHTEAELKEFLKPVPPKPIDDVLDSFEAVDGFQMQLVAREPLVTDPIAATFDEEGNLFVCEMRDYPYKPRPGQQPIGSIRLLKDTNGDGVFDEGHIFAEELLWAGGVAPWKGGIFAAAPPDIWYLKDTNGDNHADLRERVFTGFGTGNQQAMVNNLKWGLDHRIYGSTAYNGGSIRPGNQPEAPAVSVRGRDFRFDPVTREFETITGTVQFGNSFDDWGNRFLCSESQPLQHAVLPQHYLERNPYLAVPRAVVNIAPVPIPSFRISPLERWRQIRSSRRIAHGQRDPTAAGASHHVMDAAAGVTVYRGGAYPKCFYGNVFIGGAQNNLIHRRRLSPNGVTFTSARVTEKTEFIRSSDNWFRPVNFVNAPDGTLYVLDMSREILETIHVPIDVTKFIDFKHGRQHGRIYRIAPPEFQYPGPPRPYNATNAEIVAYLESPHGWWRETAHRLIFERQDRSMEPLLRRLFTESELPQARLHALWSLHGLNALTDNDLLHGLSDPHAGVREHVMKLAEGSLDATPALLDRLLESEADSNPRIQLQLAFSLGYSSDPRAATALARLARRHVDAPWIRTAILSSSNGLADRIFTEIINDANFSAAATSRTLLEQLLLVVGARGDRAEVDRVVDAISASAVTTNNSRLQFQLVVALGNALRQSGSPLTIREATRPATRKFLGGLFDSARTTALDTEQAESIRITAIRLLGCRPFVASRDTLSKLIDTRQPEPIQIATVNTLALYPEPQVATLVLDRWRQSSPAVRQEMTNTLLRRSASTIQLLRAAKSGIASVAGIETSRRELLLAHEDETIRNLANSLFGDDATSGRGDVIADYESALSLKTNATRGELVFKRACHACHKVGASGHAVGPDLTSSNSRDAQALLVHILDPNRYVLPRYEQYVCVDINGRVLTGMITAQTATSITLGRGENKTETILRGQIDEIISSGKSLMPEGLEKQIPKQAMADLIAWLQSTQKTPPSTDEPLHIGTLPGLIEPED